MKSTQSYLQIKCSFSWNTYERKLVLCIQWSCIVVISISSRLHTEFQLHHKEKTLNINVIALYVQKSRENCARYLATGSWPLAGFCFLWNGNDSSTGFEGREGGRRIYIYTGSLCIDFSVLQCSIRRSRAWYMLRQGEKTERLYFHPYKPVSWLLTHQSRNRLVGMKV